MAHYGTRGSSSVPLTDEEWRAVCAYVDDEVRRIKPTNVGAYRATVIERRMAEVIEDRAMAKAFNAIIIETAAQKIEAMAEPEIERDTGAALAAMRRGIIEGRSQRRALLGKMTAEQATDPAWR